MVIIDTDIIIKSLKAEESYKKEVTEILESQAGIITPVQIAEVYFHALSEEYSLINSFFNLFKVENFTKKRGELAGEFMQQYKPYYPELTISDCLVAAVAADTGAEIYTLHPKHFPMTQVQLYHKTIESITKTSKPRLINTTE